MSDGDMKRRVRGLIRRCTGRDIVRYGPAYSAEARLALAMEWMGVEVVVDVGAGRGEFASALYANGYAGRVISVEPCAATHAELVRAARRREGWTVVERCAAGRADGEAVLHVTRRSGSSSLRAPGAAHLRADRDSAEIGRETVPVRRLDGLTSTLIDPAAKVFLKIDVQGTEDDVLDGAAGLLPAVRGMQIELSVIELYEGQRLMPEMLAWVARHGFALWGLEPVYVDGSTGRTLQYDGVFVLERAARG